MHVFPFAGEELAALPQALWWPDRRALIVADLHLEKASWFAMSGQLLPPYDTLATLDRLAALADRLDAATIYCLGDSFHDIGADARMMPEARARLEALAARHALIWLAGNHDPVPADVPGARFEEMQIGGIILRHEARRGETRPELSGHYHPRLRLKLRGHYLWRPCFIASGVQLILPAFGALTGGLSAADEAFAALFPQGHDALIAGNGGLHRFTFDPPLRDDAAQIALPL